MTALANWQAWKEREASLPSDLDWVTRMHLLISSRAYTYCWPSPEAWDALAMFNAAPASPAGAPLAGAGAAPTDDEAMRRAARCGCGLADHD